jgi:bifunctional non-homologous end joining protein LigD
MLATQDDDELRYVGGAVGTGWSEKAARDLKKRLDELTQPRPAIAGLKVKGAVWTAPTLHAEIAYRCFTSAGELRLDDALMMGLPDRHLANSSRGGGAPARCRA